jgi:hypothetical protein
MFLNNKLNERNHSQADESLSDALLYGGNFERIPSFVVCIPSMIFSRTIAAGEVSDTSDVNYPEDAYNRSTFAQGCLRSLT